MTKRALVLSGGGPVGIAWESGIVAGLCGGGVDLRESDLIIGTSAGSVVGAQLALGREPQSMVGSHLAGQRSAQVARVTTERNSGAPDLTALMDIMAKAAIADRPLEVRLAEVGAFALNATTLDEETFIAGFGNRLAGAEAWPARDFRCTAVDAQSGQFVIWDRSSGVPLSRAVASSCAVPGIYPCITINGRRYYDGGIRSASNADLASGYETVLIVSVGGGPAASSDPRAELARQRLEDEIATLKTAGAKTVELLTPDEGARNAFGLNMMDARQNQGAAENGLRQGRELASKLREVWR
jgi:NTE family protein